MSLTVPTTLDDDNPWAPAPVVTTVATESQKPKFSFKGKTATPADELQNAPQQNHDSKIQDFASALRKGEARDSTYRYIAKHTGWKPDNDRTELNDLAILEYKKIQLRNDIRELGLDQSNDYSSTNAGAPTLETSSEIESTPYSATMSEAVVESSRPLTQVELAEAVQKARAVYDQKRSSSRANNQPVPGDAPNFANDTQGDPENKIVRTSAIGKLQAWINGNTLKAFAAVLLVLFAIQIIPGGGWFHSLLGLAAIIVPIYLARTSRYFP